MFRAILTEKENHQISHTKTTTKNFLTMSTSISSMFCFNSSDDGNYAPETSKGDFMKPLIAQEPKKEASATDQYPGYALRTAHPNDCTPENKTFVKTGGNALQAVDKSVLEEKNLVAGKKSFVYCRIHDCASFSNLLFALM